MVEQHRSQQASAQQQRYDTYAKPVLLSQPEPKPATRILSGEGAEPQAPAPNGSRKITPGKLNLSKISQGETSPVTQNGVAPWAARRVSEAACSAELATERSGNVSPGRLDLPSGTPLSRHPSDALTQRTSPKGGPQDSMMQQGQITIVAEAVAQYEQKILGQQRRKGRFSSSSSPDVSRHASVSSSAHATPRDNVTAVQSGSAAGWVAEPQSFSSAPRASRAPHGGERAEGEGPTGAPRLPKEAPGKGAQAAWALAAGLLDSASAGRNATAATSGRYEVEQSTAAALAEVSEGAAEGLPKPGAEASVASPAVAAAVLRQGTEDGAAAEQQTEGARQDSGELPVSTAAFPGPSSEPEAPPQPPRQAQPPAAADRDRPPGAAGATVAATGATGGDEPAEINGDSGGAAEESRTDAARGSGSGGSAGRRAQERESVEMQLRCEGAREPEWVAAFRRMVSLAVNTPLPLTPTPADPPSPHEPVPRAGLSPVQSSSQPAQAPSPSSGGLAAGSSAGRQDGPAAAAGPFGSVEFRRNLSTEFESALTDSRRKRLRAEASAHRSGSVVRAAAAVQRAAERAVLDRNDYSGARISQEASSALSPGAIALVNGRRLPHSDLDLTAQLSDVVHQLRFCLASMSEQQRPLLHATDILQAGKVPRRELEEAAGKLQEVERLRRWSEIAQSENIARLLGILGDIQAAQQARAEEVHFSETAWLSLLGSSPALNSNGRLAHC